MTSRILVADIGGTSSRFAEVLLHADRTVELDRTVWFKTQEATSFEHLLGKAKDQGLELSSYPLLVFGVPGPVEGGTYCKPPLIAWEICSDVAIKHFQLQRLVLVNDFVTHAFCCASPLASSAEKILPGSKREGATIAVIGAGTGLGKAFLLPDQHGNYHPGASEGGHSTFPVETKEEWEFAEFAYQKLGVNQISGDDIVSGKGIVLIHEFLSGTSKPIEEIAASFTSGSSRTLEWAARFYGRICRNFALETLSFGGVFVAGGVAAKNPILLKHPAFAEEFRHSRVHRKLLETIPVFLFVNQESGLWGAAYLAQSLMHANISPTS